MVELEKSVYDYIHNLLFSKEKFMNPLNRTGATHEFIC